MALLSRPSLRGSVRRAPEEPTDAPAPKKQRMESPSDRRKSSPDCLDTTTVEEPVKRSLKPQSRSRTRRRASSSSIDVASPAGQLATPTTRTNGTANGIKTTRARRDPTTPSSNFFDIQESPDPLDTISPAPSVAPKQRTVTPAIADDVNPLGSPVPRTTRRTDNRREVNSEGALDATVTPAPSDHKDATDEQTEEKRSERRSLRSTDTGLRCKSELAQYFHNYEQIISLEDPEPEFLAAKTTLTIIDDLSQPIPIPKPDPTPFGNPLLNLYGCTKLSLPPLPTPDPNTTPADPLNEATYFRAHRKFERQEKQLRNIERNRAQHEQQVLERLLDELRGHDWLRVMGLPSVHETEKKLYEPKREILVQELVTLVNKFQAWKDEERRRKLEKEKEKPDEADAGLRKRSRLDDDSSPAPADLQSTPDPNDVDALAARQLHQEARSAGAAKSKNRKSTSKTVSTEEESKSSPKRKKVNPTQPPAPAPTPTPASASAPAPAPAPTKNLKQASLSLFWAPAPREGPFISFFRQRHVRDAAIAATKGIRRGGSRSALAFGHPVPEVDEGDFEVPGEILTEEAILQSQRKRRRLRRKSLG